MGGAAALATSSSLGLLDTPASAATRPNILLIITDEERQNVRLPAGFRLPTRAALAAAGVRFTMHHTPTAPCSPARSTMFTGLHAPTTGVTSNVLGNQAGLKASLPSLGRTLKAAGYTTAYVGKWHLSPAAGDDPTLLQPWGFDESIDVLPESGPGMGTAEDPEIATRAAEWITAHTASTKPWFLVVSLVNPHDVMFYPKAWDAAAIPDLGAPWPSNFESEWSTKPSVQTAWHRAVQGIGGAMPIGISSPAAAARWTMYGNGYLALLRQSDRLMGQVVRAVSAAGAHAKTVTVHVADHGEMGGAHGLRQKGPMIYRENLRVPLVISDPRKPATHGTVTSALTSHIDLLPTIAALAGAAAPTGPGRNLTPLLTQPDGAVRNGLLVTCDSHDAVHGPELRSFLRGVVTSRYSYGRYTIPADVNTLGAPADLELYDRLQDPGEMHNLAQRPSGLMSKLDAFTDYLVQEELGLT
jgi:arylsulfatase A-like enzyme